MHLPYTDRYPEAVAIASQSLAVSLSAVLWSRPLRRRSANLLFCASLAGTALLPLVPKLARVLGSASPPSALVVLQGSLTLATLALALSGPRWLGWVAALGQLALLMLASWVRDSDDELMFAHLFWYGALLGCHALRSAPPRRPAATSSIDARRQDVVIFLLTFALAAFVMNRVFERVIYNGDEVANTFQADVYGHLRAYATPRPCAASFQNYWVFDYEGRLFSQYTPGWPLFMALFARLGIICLAGPAAAGLLAVGVARLSRRAVTGFGSTALDALRISRIAGPLGAGLMMLGPSALLNGASRFSHTLVAACFAWAVESAAAVATPGISRRRALFYGLGLGLATSLGLATRPSDGGVLGVGVFVYFVTALARRRVSWAGFWGTCLGFTSLGLLTLVILRLQVGSWFHTGYAVTPLFHPEGTLTLAPPLPGELKFGIPLATGSYCWWPIAPALGVGGLVRCLAGRERRVASMLGLGVLGLVGFYSFVTFGRGGDDGLGPRYIMPVIVAQATGSAALLAPLIARLFEAFGNRALRPRFRLALAGPALLALAAALVGTYELAPLTYPVAYAENHAATAPLRAARDRKLERAVVLLEPNRLPAHETNLAQNAPMDPDPSVLFLIRRSPADDACIRKHFRGRSWYRAGLGETLERVPGR